MISVKYGIVDNDLLKMYRKGANVDPFVYQSVDFDNERDAIDFALMKATATRVDGFKKSASVRVVDGDILIDVIDVASKKRN